MQQQPMPNKYNLQNQISRLNTRLAKFQEEIAMYQAEPITDPDVQALVATRVTELTNQITQVTTQITDVQNKLNNVLAIEAQTYTAEQQTKVDEINTLFSSKYAGKLSAFVTSTAEEKTNFFNLYDKAGSTPAKERVILAYFKINSFMM